MTKEHKGEGFFAYITTKEKALKQKQPPFDTHNDFLLPESKFLTTPAILVDPHRIIAVLRGMIEATGSTPSNPVPVGIQYTRRIEDTYSVLCVYAAYWDKGDLGGVDKVNKIKATFVAQRMPGST